jgi:ubiquinone/menaquinone biosynthesis C-methylase UbiE
VVVLTIYIVLYCLHVCMLTVMSHEQEPFDWYYPYEQFAEMLNERVAKEGRIMDAGCGNSDLVQSLAEDGFTNITGCDFSRVVIDQLKARCEDYPEIELVCCNMQDSNLPKDSFDCIIDKGLLDTIACNLQSTEAVANYIAEVERLLVDDGMFICISVGAPEDRLKFLEIYDIDLPLFTPWYTDVIAMEKPREYDGQDFDQDEMSSFYFIYICRMEPKLAKQKKDRVKQQAQKKKKAAKHRKKNHKNDV